MKTGKKLLEDGNQNKRVKNLYHMSMGIALLYPSYISGLAKRHYRRMNWQLIFVICFFETINFRVFFISCFRDYFLYVFY